HVTFLFTEIQRYCFCCRNSCVHHSMMKSTTLLLVCIVLHCFVLPAICVKRTASGNGVKWSSASTWTPRGVPARADDVVIPSGAHVLFDTGLHLFLAKSRILAYCVYSDS